MKKAILIVVGIYAVVGAYVGSSIFSKKISASNVQEIVLR
jgi:hypothetical protein